MAEERSVLVLEVRIDGEKNLRLIEKFKKDAKDADSVTQKLSKKIRESSDALTKYAKSFSNLEKNLKNIVKSANDYANSTDRLQALDKAHDAIIKNKDNLQKKAFQTYKELTIQINNTKDATEKAILIEKRQAVQLEYTASKLRHEAAASKVMADKKKALSQSVKNSTEYLERYVKALRSTSNSMQQYTPGVQRLIGATKAELKVKEASMKMEARIQKDLAQTQRQIDSTTDAVVRASLEKKKQILIEAQSKNVVEQNIAINKLYVEQERSKERIRAQANERLKIYKITLTDVQKAVRGQIDDTDKLASAYRGKGTAIREAGDVLEHYDAKISKTNKKLALATDQITKEALQLKLTSLERARYNVILERNSAVSRMQMEATRALTKIERESTQAIQLHKDKVSQLKKEIQNETNIVKKASVATKNYKEVKRQATYIEKDYIDKIKGVDAQLKKTTDAYAREALMKKRNALETAKLKAQDVAHNSVLEVKRMMLDSVSSALTRASQSLQRFGRFMSRYVTTVMTAALVQGIKFQANIEAQTIRFGILVRNMEKGRDLFQQIVAYSAKTPFLLPDLDEAAQILLAFGSPLESVMDELRMLGDVAQGDAEKLERVATSFGKVRARGTAHMRELNRFIMSGIPIIEELNNQFGTTGDEIFRMIQKNEITFENINRAMENMTSSSGRFYKMTDTIAKTLEGRFSTAVDNLNLNLAKLVEDFTPMVKGILEQFIDWSQGFRTLDAQTRQLTVKMMALAAAIGPASIAMAGFIKVLANAIAGNVFGAVILGITTIAGLVSWGIIKNEIDDVSEAAATMQQNMELLRESTSFKEGMVPGMTQELWDLARATGDYTLAIQHNNEALEIRRRLATSDDTLTKQEKKLYERMIMLSQYDVVGVTESGFRPRTQFGTMKRGFFDNVITGTEKEIKDILDMMSSAFPEVKTMIDDKIMEVFGRPFSFDKLSKAQLASLDIGGLFKEILDEVDIEYSNFMDAIESSNFVDARAKILEEKAKAFETGVVFREEKGLDFSALFRAWGEEVTKGISNIGADVEEGIIDFGVAISRASSVRETIKRMEQDVIQQIREGGITPKDWADFFDADTPEQLIEQLKADSATALEEYASFLKGAVDYRIFEIKEASALDNAIASFLGLDNEENIKSQLQAQLSDYTELLKSFGYTAQQIHMFESGELMAPDYVQAILDAVGIAKLELEKILEREKKLSLFSAFFESDPNAFQRAVIQSQIQSQLRIISDALAEVPQLPSVMDAFSTAMTEGDFSNIDNATARQRILNEVINEGYTKVEIEKIQNALLELTHEGGMNVIAFAQNISTLYEALGSLNDAVDTSKIESVFTTFFSGTKDEGIEALNAMLDQLNFQDTVDEAITQVKDIDQRELIKALIYGDDIAGLKAETREELEAFFADVFEDVAEIDIGAHESILERLVGSPENLRADLEQMLKELEFAEALQKAVESEEDFSSIDLLKRLIEDPEKMRNSPAYKNLVALFTEAFPEDIEKAAVPDAIEKAAVPDAMLEAFLGTKEDWRAYKEKLRLDELRKSFNEDIAKIADDMDMPIDTVFDKLESISEFLSFDPSDTYLSKTLGIKPEELDALLGNMLGITPEELDALLEVYKQLKKKIEITKDDVLEGVIDSLGDALRNNLLPAIEEIGAALLSWDSSAAINSLLGLGKAIFDVMPQMLFQLGWSAITNKIPSDDILGWSLLGASGLLALGTGIASGGAPQITESEGSLSYSANGDIFKNGYIASAPTLRSTSYGASMIGEAGDEAVLPLMRTSGGQLGVQAGTAPIIINVNNTSKATVEATETTDADGARVVEFAVYDFVKKGFANGEFDNSLSLYGVNRRGRR
jgi:tape measure domain-containing protein